MEALCTMNCPGLEGISPLLRCNVCMCLFHPQCVNYRGSIDNGFVCLVGTCRNEYLSCNARKRSLVFLTRFNVNRSVQSQKNARCLKFHIQVEEELYYLYSENKDIDQLCN